MNNKKMKRNTSREYGWKGPSPPHRRNHYKAKK